MHSVSSGTLSNRKTKNSAGFRRQLASTRMMRVVCDKFPSGGDLVRHIFDSICLRLSKGRNRIIEMIYVQRVFGTAAMQINNHI